MEFSRFLKMHRRRQGLSQRELAEGICSAGYISRIEQGLRLPSAQMLLDLVRRLQTPLVRAVHAFGASHPGVPRLAELATLLVAEGELNLATEMLHVAREQLNEDLATFWRDVAACDRAQAYLCAASGDLDNAMRFARQRLRRIECRNSEPFLQAEACYEVGNLALRLGKHEEAETMCFRAWWGLWRLPMTGDETAKERVAVLYQRITWSLGLTLLKTRQVMKADMIYRQAEVFEQQWGVHLRKPASLRSDMAVAAIGVGNFHSCRSLTWNPGTVFGRSRTWV